MPNPLLEKLLKKNRALQNDSPQPKAEKPKLKPPTPEQRASLDRIADKLKAQALASQAGIMYPCPETQCRQDSGDLLVDLKTAGFINDESGLSLEDMAQKMLDEGWDIPLDDTGHADLGAFVEMLRDTMNGNPPVHPDDRIEE